MNVHVCVCVSARTHPHRVSYRNACHVISPDGGNGGHHTEEVSLTAVSYLVTDGLHLWNTCFPAQQRCSLSSHRRSHLTVKCLCNVGHMLVKHIDVLLKVMSH